MSENELKVKTVEQNGKILEFKESVPISSLKFVSDCVITLHNDIDKMSQWFTAQQIIDMCRKKLNIEVIESLGKLSSKRKVTLDMIVVSERVFENFYGQVVPEKEITKFIGETYPNAHPTTWSNWKRLVVGILSNQNKIVKSGKSCIFSSKVKIDSPKDLTTKSYSNAKENGLD